MINRNDAILVVVDIQERMLPVIDRAEQVCDNALRLIRGCSALGIPMLVTEQYSKGLGPTIPEVREAMGDAYRPIEKMSFSCAGEMSFLQQLEISERRVVLLCGVETHVCVYQTARDLRTMGWDVEVIADAVGSRRDENYRLALDRMRANGVGLASVEMVLFEMMGRADIPEFRGVSRIVK